LHTRHEIKLLARLLEAEPLPLRELPEEAKPDAAVPDEAGLEEAVRTHWSVFAL
jgi:hypothetical protein